MTAIWVKVRHVTHPQTLGEQIRAARLAKKLTQDQLAAKIGADGGRRTIIRWETDVHFPDAENRAKLIETLSLPAEIFAEEERARQSVERRVAALEQAVAQIEHRLFGGASAQDE